MRKAYFPVLIASLLFIVHSNDAESSTVSDRNLILTEGKAEVIGQNDSAKISIAVLTDGRNLEQVSSLNADKSKKVLDTIKSMNLRNLKLKTSNFRVTPHRDYQKARPPRIKGYEVYNAIEVTLEGFEPEQLSKHISKIIGKSLESDANHINHIQFYIQKREVLEKEAITQATRKAMDRAETLAKAAGVRLKRIVSLNTHPLQMPSRQHMFRAATMKSGAEAMMPPIESGESKISAQVSIAYEIE